MDYWFVAQGKTSIPGVNDGEELELTDVRHLLQTYILKQKRIPYIETLLSGPIYCIFFFFYISMLSCFIFLGLNRCFFIHLCI